MTVTRRRAVRERLRRRELRDRREARGIVRALYVGRGFARAQFVISHGIALAALVAIGADEWHPVVLIAVIWRVFDDGAKPVSAGVATALTPPTAAESASARRDAFWLVALYSLAGFGYIITATFLPVIARQALPGSSWPDYFWPLFGAAIIPGALIGARAPTHWDNRLLMAAAYALQAAGVILSVVWPTIVGFGIGSLLLGMPFTAITLFAVREARPGDHVHE